MNKISRGTRLIRLQAVCTALVLILGGSLFAAGAMGAGGCGMKCCCQIGLTHMQPAAEKKMRAALGCCAGLAASSCDLQSARPIELPEISLRSCCLDLPHVGGPTVILTDIDDLRQNPGGNFIIQVLEPKSNSLPLYLQKSSFLI